MTLDNLSPEQIDNKQQELISAMPLVGAIGNKALREKLGATWSEDLYWKIRNHLIEHGRIETGRGKGGSVKLISTSTQQTEPEPTIQPTPKINFDSIPDYSKEVELYEPISRVLRSHWSKAQGFDNSLVEITAKQGSKSTGGKWSRPDVAAVGYRTFRFLPNRIMEVVSFEIKPTNTFDVTSVYEALAHRRAATHSYVLGHVPPSARADMEIQIDTITKEAKKLGIGVIIAEDPTDFDTWDQVLDADRIEPDPARLNDFLMTQISSELQEQFIRWFK